MTVFLKEGDDDDKETPHAVYMFLRTRLVPVREELVERMERGEEIGGLYEHSEDGSDDGEYPDWLDLGWAGGEWLQ